MFLLPFFINYLPLPSHICSYPFWHLNFYSLFVWLLSFYIIINQFDTFTSALKRKPQGFVDPKCHPPSVFPFCH